MTKRYTTAFFIGRFEPWHNGHQYGANKALEIADKVVILIGSSNVARSPKNPFSVEERRDMILASFPTQPVNIEFLDDRPEEDWIADVQAIAQMYEKDPSKICIVGHEKDASSYYLRIFPQWKFIDVHTVDLKIAAEQGPEIVDATDIRDLVFRNKLSYVQGVVPPAVHRFLTQWRATSVAAQLAEEHKYIQDYKKSWASTPFPPTFITTDAVVVQSGHVLLIKRGEAPGKGLWALPGGFLGINEFIKDSCIRELLEETSIKLQPEVLSRCIVASEVFDNPYRSTRGRTVTHAFMFKLEDSKPLPPLKGADDAAHAEWVPFNKILDDPQNMFEDHHQILTVMLRKLRSQTY